MNTILQEQAASLRPITVSTQEKADYRLVIGSVQFDGLVSDRNSVEFAISTLEILSNQEFISESKLLARNGLTQIKSMVSNDLLLIVHATACPEKGVSACYRAHYRHDHVSANSFVLLCDSLIDEYETFHLDYSTYIREGWING